MKINKKSIENPFWVISITYILVVILYLSNSSSRSALLNAKSSHLQNNLTAKSLLITFALLLSISVVYLFYKIDISRSITKLEKYKRYLPLFFFITFNAIPAFIQNFKNVHLIDKYYSLLPNKDKENAETLKKIDKMRNKIDFFVNFLIFNTFILLGQFKKN